MVARRSLRAIEPGAGAGIEQTTGDDGRPAHNAQCIGLIEPADLPVLGVNGIDAPGGRGIEGLVHERMQSQRSLRKRINGDAPEHCPILRVQSMGAAVHDAISHQRHCEVHERHGSNPGIGRGPPAQRSIIGSERTGIVAKAANTDIDHATHHPRHREGHPWRRRRAYHGMMFRLPGPDELHVLAPARRAVGGVDGIQEFSS